MVRGNVERKLATVLFVDIVDSTQLVTGADPEVVRRRVAEFFDRVSHCVTVQVFWLPVCRSSFPQL